MSSQVKTDTSVNKTRKKKITNISKTKVFFPYNALASRCNERGNILFKKSRQETSIQEAMLSKENFQNFQSLPVERGQ